jgi:hypothetical protein
MASEPATATNVLTDEQLARKTTMIKRMLMVGGAFVAVGYLLIGMALFFELSVFHPLIDDFVSTYTQWSIAGGGPDRAGEAALNAQLATIHQWPSTLLWLKLGGIGHILTGVFIALASIVRALSLMPERLGTVVSTSMSTGSPGAAVDPADD